MEDWARPPGQEQTEGLLVAYQADTDSFVLNRGDGLTYYLYIPATAHLVADVTSAEPAGTAAQVPQRLDSCAVAVRVRAPGIDLAGELAGPGATMELDSFAGRVVRVDFQAKLAPAGQSNGCSATRMSKARLTIAGQPVSPHNSVAPRHIVVWIMDTLRADRVRPFHSGARPEVPHLDRLALTGTVFGQFWVQGNESQTSHSSLWTSLYPVVHNVRTAGKGGTYKLSRRFDKIAEVLKRAGFYTVGITANGYVSRVGGYAEGFDVWRNLMREGLAVKHSVPAARIVDLGLEFFGQRYKESPVFLFMGTIDTHKPWIGREPWLSRYDPEPYRGPHKKRVSPKNLGMAPGTMRCAEMPRPRDLVRINAIYDSGVSYQDQQLGRFYAQLEDWGIAGETLIMITADHGEELWEHGICGHGASLRETLVRVPLVVHYPPLFPGGRVVVEGAESVDIVPTLLDALDRPDIDAAQGHSLIPLAQGVGRGYPLPSYASQYEYAHAMRLGDWKARVGKSGVPNVYNLAEDPNERRDLAGTRPIERRYLTDALSLFLVYRHLWKKRQFGVASNMTGQAVLVLEGLGSDRAAEAGTDEAGTEDAPTTPRSASRSSRSGGRRQVP